jgi:ABC-type multidrug transport system fused ATPase/permease subunit
MYIGMFAILFGAFAASGATGFAPDVARAKVAAQKICAVLYQPSKMDPMDPKKIAQRSVGEFKGEIEFKNVWFRYPSNTSTWVLKGLNLTIKSNENVAVVGESGSGKSTLINLIMRFYDPQFGEILIDGYNVKEYDIQGLRQRMGLVMQEPTLFNYTIRENILYGKIKAQNAELIESAQVANALEFIQAGSEGIKIQDDDLNALKEAMELRAGLLIESMGEDKY